MRNLHGQKKVCRLTEVNQRVYMHYRPLRDHNHNTSKCIRTYLQSWNNSYLEKSTSNDQHNIHLCLNVLNIKPK